MRKIIVVTGVSSGIGEALVRKIPQSFPDSIIIGLGRKNSQNLVNIKNYHFIELDISNRVEIESVFSQINNLYGTIDVLINNAGAGIRGTIEDISIDEAKEQFDINFWGAVICIKSVLPIMCKKNSGVIINISSLSSVVFTPTFGFYSAAKSALNTISEILTDELMHHNISIFSVFPGAVKTKFGKNIQQSKSIYKSKYSNLYKSWDRRFSRFFRKAITAEEIAEKIIKLISSKRRRLYPTRRDSFLVIMKRIFPEKIYKFILLKIFYKE